MKNGIGVIFMSNGDNFVFECDNYKSAEFTFNNQFSYDAYAYSFDFFRVGDKEYEKFKELL